MGVWMNNDGLYLRLGTNEGGAIQSGEYNELGPTHTVEVELPLISLSAGTSYFPSDTITLPVGARIEEVEVVAETLATTGTSAALNVGLIRNDRSTLVSATGFVNALAVTAIDAAGEKNVLRIGTTGVGALVGTTLAFPGYIVATTSTGTFTAGRAIVRVMYYIP